VDSEDIGDKPGPGRARGYKAGMDELPSPSSIAHTIQAAVAPVFLLAGIGSMLNVFAARLARVVDRARMLEKEIGSLDEGERGRAAAELGVLDRRMATVHRAIYCCTASALLVCVVVALLFIGDLTHIGSARIISWMFVTAMGLIVAGLAYFLIEVGIATRSVRVRRDLLPERVRRH
jgi:hypothetical protein